MQQLTGSKKRRVMRAGSISSSLMSWMLSVNSEVRQEAAPV